jgi:methylated-DNA-protein-cysteine methyltransferase related protein
MAKPSPFFARIKRDILIIMASVPERRLVTFKDVGAYLDVMPRHVAYILTMLEPDEMVHCPWFRAVPEDGILKTPKSNTFGISQRELLAREGHMIAPDGRVLDLGQACIAVAVLPHGMTQQQRPADAPRARASKARPNRLA